MAILGKLGDRPRVTIRRVVRVQYRLEWEFDGRQHDYDPDVGYGGFEPVRKAKSRYVSSAAVAYRMAAMRLIFAKRDKLATGENEKGYPSGCLLCDETTCGPEEMPQCRYHGGDGFDELRKRLARWLRWRDSVTAEKLSDRSLRSLVGEKRDQGLIGRKK